MSDWILPVILAVIASLPGLFGLWRQLRRDNVETNATYKAMFDDELLKRRAAEKTCDDYQDQIDVLERECANKARYIRRLTAYIELTGGDVPPIEDTKPRR
jgi:hypothetical protein